MNGLMSERPLLISSLLDHAARYHGNTEIISSDSDGIITRSNYQKVNIRAKKLAQALIKLGAKKGDTIATMAWSNLRHYELYFGVSGIGTICHTINPRLFPEQLIFIINDAKDKFLFIDIDFIPLIENLLDKVDILEKIIVLCDTNQMPSSSKLSNLICYEDLLDGEEGNFEWPMFDEKTASSLCYTSGTTGNPKGVLYSHRSTVIHAFAAAAPDAMNLSARDTIMPIAPMFHANAWAIPYVTTMVGAKLVLPGRNLDGKSVQFLIESESVSFTAAVPTIWLMLFEYLEQTGKKLDSLKSCVVGGSACPRFMMEKFYEKYGVEVLHCWGMTETSPIGTINRPLPKHKGQSFTERLDIAVKQGRPVYGIEIKITDESGILLPNNGKDFGNLWVRGPWICSGYLNIENSETHVEDDWFLTGDVATIDADGFMQITDRTKDVIKSGGEWISSIEIENFAVGHPSVMEAGVIGVFHPKWDERPLLIIVKNENLEVTKDEILSFLKDKIASWWMPNDVVFVDSLPHTATGKIQKLQLREQFKDYKFNL